MEKAEAKVAHPSTQSLLDHPIYYYVSPGDSLSKIAKAYNTSVHSIKRANNLTSDLIKVNQSLIIPKAFHTVKQKDYLSVLAKEYNVPVRAIKEANQLPNDNVQIGQTLIIPLVVDGQANSTEISSSEADSFSYKVISGDSLWAIANRYNVTIGAIKAANSLTSDTLIIGQILNIPTGKLTNSTDEGAAPGAEDVQYTVTAGDSLWAIANRYGVSVDAIRTSNNLDSDVLQVGQKLIISQGNEPVLPPVAIPATDAASYTVKGGDSLSGIAKKYNITVQQLKQKNNLNTDMIRIGQVLQIPGGQATVDQIPPQETNAALTIVQKNLKTLGYYALPTMTGNYDNITTQAIQNFQKDYGLPINGKADAKTSTAIEHAVVKDGLVKDTANYLGIPYLWGGTTTSGFDCSGFIYYMFNKHGVDMPRNTSAGLYQQGQAVQTSALQPGDLVFFAVNTSGSISHVGFYLGDNQWVSATTSKGIAVYSMDNSYWSKYYVGAKRVY
ncbi:LysM peptidoglycan-binding domain-containing protein [Oceanobacillus bengalensis]|uniref:LysM peptidoglycan-binding domain-containing protein n=2 Tax=Oceanobacillus bengalensis TaxID=1435466 RepID=A0A494YXV2_9BACI|nr:LysM peptidoglycan-binding domain-containing protein [Oceanobacillus bengalensis]